MILGTRCNVCDAPLVVPDCPLCVTCCDREPGSCDALATAEKGC